MRRSIQLLFFLSKVFYQIISFNTQKIFPQIQPQEVQKQKTPTQSATVVVAAEFTIWNSFGMLTPNQDTSNPAVCFEMQS